MRYKQKYIPTFKKKEIYTYRKFSKKKKNPSKKTPDLYLPHLFKRFLAEWLEDVLVTYLVLQRNTWENWLKEVFILAQGSRVQPIVLSSLSPISAIQDSRPENAAACV